MAETKPIYDKIKETFIYSYTQYTCFQNDYPLQMISIGGPGYNNIWAIDSQQYLYYLLYVSDKHRKWAKCNNYILPSTVAASSSSPHSLTNIKFKQVVADENNQLFGLTSSHKLVYLSSHLPSLLSQLNLPSLNTSIHNVDGGGGGGIDSGDSGDIMITLQWREIESGNIYFDQFTVKEGYMFGVGYYDFRRPPSSSPSSSSSSSSHLPIDNIKRHLFQYVTPLPPPPSVQNNDDGGGDDDNMSGDDNNNNNAAAWNIDIKIAHPFREAEHQSNHTYIDDDHHHHPLPHPSHPASPSPHISQSLPNIQRRDINIPHPHPSPSPHQRIMTSHMTKSVSTLLPPSTATSTSTAIASHHHHHGGDRKHEITQSIKDRRNKTSKLILRSIKQKKHPPPSFSSSSSSSSSSPHHHHHYQYSGSDINNENNNNGREGGGDMMMIMKWREIPIDFDITLVEYCRGDLWAIDTRGHLYHNISLSLSSSSSPFDVDDDDHRHFEKSFWKMEEMISMNEEEDDVHLIKIVAVNKAIWALTSDGRLYARVCCNFFRKVILDDKYLRSEIINSDNNGNGDEINNNNNHYESINNDHESSKYVRSPIILEYHADDMSKRSPHGLRIIDISVNSNGHVRAIATSSEVNMIGNHHHHHSNNDNNDNDGDNNVASFTLRFRPQRLLVRTVNSYEKIWSNKDISHRQSSEISIWKPWDDQFYSVCCYAERSLLPYPFTYNFESPPSSKVLVVQTDREMGDENEPEDEAFMMLKPLISAPINFRLIWDDRNCTSIDGVSIWEPIPPPSYVSLGHIATRTNNAYKPTALESVVVCVHKSVVYPGSLHSLDSPGYLWEYKQLKNEYPGDVYIWLVEGYKGEGISPGAFLAFNNPPTSKTPKNTPIYTLNLSDDDWSYLEQQ